MRHGTLMIREVDDIQDELLSIEFQLLQLKRLQILTKYSSDQPRAPAGSPSGGRWTQGSSPSAEGSRPTSRVPATSWETDGLQLAARRLSRAREQFCEEQYSRDTFQCTIVGLPACHAQAMLRYSSCLAGRQIPPLNY